MAHRKGLFGVDWGAVGDIVGGVVLGEPEKVAEALTRGDAPTEPAPPPVHDPSHADSGCGAQADGMHCIGLTPEGLCIMVKDA